MKKIILPVLVTAAVVGGLGFYGGTQYAAGSMNASATRTGGQVRGLGGGQRNGSQQGGFTAGDVIAKDDKSITIQMRDGGSKIVFLADSTSVTKSVSGATSDIVVGSQVTVMGSANSDGSVTAQSVQIRPASSAKSN